MHGGTASAMQTFAACAMLAWLLRGQAASCRASFAAATANSEALV